MTNKKTNKPLGKLGRIIYSCCDAIQRYSFGLQKQYTNGGILVWGDENRLPEHIFNLYLKDEIFSTIINGMVDYVMGDGIEIHPTLKAYIDNNLAYDSKQKDPFRFKDAVNSKGDDLQDIVRQSIKDYILFGTYADDIIFSSDGEIAEINYIDVSNIRLKAGKKEVAYYYDGFLENRHSIIPLFLNTPDGINEDGTEIIKKREIFLKFDEKCRTVYNLPHYFAGLDSIEIDKDIKIFHKKGLENGLSNFKIIFLPGNNISNDEKDETDEEIRRNFTGVYNAGKPMLVFDDGTQVRPEILTAPEDNYDTKYNSLYENTFERIFCALRTHPILYGILQKSTGFSENEFFEVLKLNLNTLFIPIRNEIIRDYSYIIGIEKDELFSFKPSILEQHIQECSETDSNQLINSILPDLTINERRELGGYEPLNNNEGDKTVLAESLGISATQSLLEIIKDTELSNDTKKGTLKVLFGLTDEDINLIIK